MGIGILNWEFVRGDFGVLQYLNHQQGFTAPAGRNVCRKKYHQKVGSPIGAV